MTLFDKDTDWRIIRSHHPVFNNFAQDSEQIEFFGVDLGKGEILMDKIKNAKINIMLASHNLTGQLQMFS